MRVITWCRAAGVFPALLAAQQPTRPPSDSLRLSALQAEALQADPRQQQLRLQAAYTDLRLRNIAAERLPTVAVDGLVQYQSDVVSFGLELPTGLRPPSPPHDTYDARVNAREMLFDPTAGPRRATERAQLGETQAQLRTTLFALRHEVTASFFAAAALDARANELGATIADLESRRREAVIRVREGVSLPSDTASLEAAILQRREDDAEFRANRRAALGRLAQLVGRPLEDNAVLTLPDLGDAVAQARATLDGLRARPEYAQFSSTRERLARDADLINARARPTVSAFARVGYGKPGLDILNNSFDAYWLAGVQLQWTPFVWGTGARIREGLVLQQRIVATNETAFTESLRRSVQEDLQTMDRLEATLAADNRIIALREQVERETRARLQEGVVTAADFVARSTELLQARLARASHRVALAQARAQFLTTLGLEVR